MTKPRKPEGRVVSDEPDRVTEAGDPEGQSIGNTDDTRRGRHLTPDPNRETHARRNVG